MGQTISLTLVEHLEGDISQVGEDLGNFSLQVLEAAGHVLVDGEAADLLGVVFLPQKVSFHLDGRGGGHGGRDTVASGFSARFSTSLRSKKLFSRRDSAGALPYFRIQ